MLVEKISIRNILGIEALDIDAGRVTIIEGDNGSGKTSVLESIRSVINGGHDATLLRNGAEEGEVVLVLEDGTELWKRITPTRSALKITDPAGKPVRRPAGWVKGLTDALCINPVNFLTCTAKDRARILLEAMPLPVDDDLAGQIDAELAACKIDWSPARDNSLDAINEARQKIYDARTGHNRALKKAKADEERLTETIPFGFDASQDHRVEINKLRLERNKLAGALAANVATVTANASQGAAGVWSTFNRRKAQMEGALSRKLSEMRAEAQRKASRVEAEAATDVRTLEADAQEPLDELARKIVETEESARSADYHCRSLRLLEDAQKDVSWTDLASGDCTYAIGQLDALKAQILESLPIFGLSVRDGRVYHFDVPFERLNHAGQVQVAVDVARLRAGDVPLVCVDGLECLDPKSFDLFVDAMADSGLQAIVTRVTEDNDLVVNTIRSE